MSRESQTDNAKHGAPLTKAAASEQMPARPTMGAWCAPGQVTVSASSEGDDEYQERS